MAVFHEFFHLRETKAFVRYARPDLERSESYITEGNLGKSSARTTKQTYVPEGTKHLPEASLISDRILLATSLKARFWPREESEEWQVNIKLF